MDSGLNQFPKERLPPGTWLENDRLVVSTWHGQAVVGPWPRLPIWRRTASEPYWYLGRAYACSGRFRNSSIHCTSCEWEPAAPFEPWCALQLLLPDPADPDIPERTEQEADWLRLLDRFLAGIPAAVPEAACGFKEPARWELLVLAGLDPGALDLMIGNPALAYGLALNDCFRGGAGTLSRPELRRLVRGRQREALAALGFPGTESAARILRKLPRSLVHLGALLDLRESLAQEHVSRLLAHVPRINDSVLAAVMHPAVCAAVSPRLLIELSDGPGNDHLVEFMSRTLEGRGRVRFHSLDQVVRWHEVWIEELNRMRPKDLPWDGRFPLPPVPGTKDIVPIPDAQTLFEEGREMRHCVASWASDVRRGVGYVYRMLQPERATLAITPHGRRWVLHEIQGSCNRPVSPATRQAAEFWLAAARIRTRPDRERTGYRRRG